MNHRFKHHQVLEKSFLPSKISENPVLSSRSRENYVGITSLSPRLYSASPDSFCYSINSSRKIFKFQKNEILDFEDEIRTLISQTHDYEAFTSVLLSLNTISKLCLSILPSLEQKKISQEFPKILESLGQILDLLKKTGQINEKNSKDLQKEKETTKNLTFQIKQLQSSLQGTSNKFLQIEKTKNESVQKLEKSARKQIVEREKHIEKIQMLEDYIEELKNVTKIEQISKELQEYKDKYEHLSKEYKGYSKQKESMIYKMEMTIGSYKEKLDSNEKYLSSFYDEQKKNQDLIQLLEKNIDVLKEKICERNERLGLFKEDMVRFFNCKNLYEETKEHVEFWKNKYQQIEQSIASGSYSKGAERAIWISLNDPVFSIVRESAVCSHVLNIPSQKPSVVNKIDQAVEYQKKKNESHSDNKIDISEINLKIYKMNRPLFITFLDINDTTLPLMIPFQNWLEVTVRGIYDSKYYEHQLCTFESGRIPSRFPEFVYSWLGSFTVDQKTRQVKELENWRKSSGEKIRMDFILSLGQDKYKQNWEIKTFIEFLNEDLMIDELAFYLHCRNYLFKGAQLLLNTGKYASIHFLPIKKVEEALEKILEKVSGSDRNELKDLLRKKARLKDGQFALDSGLVLRLLLEYYIREKRAKFIAIRSFYEFADKNYEMTGVTFTGFRDIIRNLDNQASDIVIAKMYRDCFSICNGIITADYIFTICNESLLFFSCLCVKQDVSCKQTELSSILSTYKLYKSSLELIKVSIKNIGVIELINNFNKLESYFLNEYSGVREFNEKSSFRKLWALVFQIQNAFLDANIDNLSMFLKNSDDNEELVSGPQSCRFFIELLGKIALHKINAEFAVRKIQRKWKERRYSNKGKLIFNRLNTMAKQNK
ncbi:hypothetical protein SteCoe_22429 [Stentor coeruleus]|uniref:Uncharacterized protein n=1 Tax=Stentor coeruleus TaxID=5963 RepID=A0A1R2BM87_9CILI|nr:hypothetical protein SteCoe_22429 [Stentor coeruleus]